MVVTELKTHPVDLSKVIQSVMSFGTTLQNAKLAVFKSVLHFLIEKNDSSKINFQNYNSIWGIFYYRCYIICFFFTSERQKSIYNLSFWIFAFQRIVHFINLQNATLQNYLSFLKSLLEKCTTFQKYFRREG